MVNDVKLLYARSPLYKTLIGAKLGVFFCFHSTTFCFANEILCKGRFAPLATRGIFTCLFGSVFLVFSYFCNPGNCSILYLLIKINATHMQARTIITVLDFLLAQNTPPVTLWVCRRRLFAPRDSARPEIRCLS